MLHQEHYLDCLSLSTVKLTVPSILINFPTAELPLKVEQQTVEINKRCVAARKGSAAAQNSAFAACRALTRLCEEIQRKPSPELALSVEASLLKYDASHRAANDAYFSVQR